MFETVTVSNRRALNFPAIQPSDEVSPYTLLNSLVDIAAKICGYRSRFFASNDRNARESMRQVGVLLVLLEELRDSAAELPDGVVLSLSELHVAFQKLRWLLEDCSRDGARVWMLAKSELVAGQFRSLVRSISTAMDVFPMDGIGIGDELREHVELAMRQARKSRFEFDSDDKRVLQIVHSVLFGFENMVIPDRDVLKQVLDYLGIDNWTKCHKEAKFLESEMELESQSKERTEMSFLSSLTALVCYCRCAAFDSVDGEPVRRVDRESRGGSLVGVNGDDFRCPILLDIMSDPVTIASGHSYDRASIAKWFGAGNFTCPKTGEKLPSAEMIPNPALRRLIQLYCSENAVELADHSGQRNRRAKREFFELSSAAEKAVKLAVISLAEALETGTVREKSKAACEVRILSKTSSFNRACLVESGVVEPLLRLSVSSADSPGQENSIAALLNLSKCSEARDSMFRHGGFEAIVEVLRNGLSSEARQHAAGVLFYLASSKDRRPSIGEYPETIPGLVELVRDGTERGKKNALLALFALLANQGNCFRVLASGIVPLLADLLASSDSEELIVDSLAVLSILAEDFDGTSAILCCGRGLDSVIEILNCSDSRPAKEHCVTLLLCLCKNREKDVVSLLVKSHSLMGSLYLLVSQGTSRASKKASALIRVLHEFHERRASGLIAPFLSQERIIRAW